MGLKIYTKTGDDGTSSLFGGKRVKKSDLRLETYGTVDELNSWVGLIRSLAGEKDLNDLLAEIQNKLFVIGSKLASDENGKMITDRLTCSTEDIEKLEKAMDEYEARLKPLQNFILPGGSSLVSYCHIARTVCRRAERRIVELSGMASMENNMLKYVNRLSDYLFVLARKIAQDEGISELKWDHA
jgi:cob(I)alamin adenosyltransferase